MRRIDFMLSRVQHKCFIAMRPVCLLILHRGGGGGGGVKIISKIVLKIMFNHHHFLIKRKCLNSAYALIVCLPKKEIRAAIIICLKIVSEYDQEIPQSQTADNPVASRGRAAQPPRDTRKTN